MPYRCANKHQECKQLEKQLLPEDRVGWQRGSSSSAQSLSSGKEDNVCLHSVRGTVVELEYSR